MNKDRVVIEVGCMRYVVGVSDTSCPLKNSGGSCIACKTQVPEVYAVCNEMGVVSCISATKIEPSPKMYFAWNRKDANGLVGMDVEAHTGRSLDKWKKVKLGKISNCSAYFPFETLQENFPIIREIPTIKLTRAELNEKYGVPDNVVIVEDD